MANQLGTTLGDPSNGFANWALISLSLFFLLQQSQSFIQIKMSVQLFYQNHNLRDVLCLLAAAFCWYRQTGLSVDSLCVWNLKDFAVVRLMSEPSKRFCN
jgi:hypothetical protein